MPQRLLTMSQPSPEQNGSPEKSARLQPHSLRRLLYCFGAFTLGLALSYPLPAQNIETKSDSAKVAYFAGGCFWCTQEIFRQMPGVTSVVSGYMFGAETIEVAFDPAKMSYEKLLTIFWRAHDPTEVDRQGPDTGRQYRSAIFYINDQQRETAEKSKRQLQATHTYPKPIATEITRAGGFDRADEHHQNFCRKNPNNPYIQQTLVPKLKKLGLKLP
jgi:peptide-methionine (S)-S-oxide reductase